MKAIAMRALALFVTLAVLLAMPDSIWAQGRPAQVGVDTVVLEPFVQTAPVLGRIVARQQGVVAARVAGPVASVAVDAGDRVEAGQELARLDVTRLEIEKSMAEADLVTAQSELATAQAQLALLVQERARLQQLKGSAAFSRARLDDKNNEILVAQSRIDSARARASRAEVVASYRQTDVDDGILRAAYPGVIVRKLVSAGAYVRVGDPVVEMVNNQDVEIEADVPAIQLSGLDAGAEVNFRIDDELIQAELRAILPVESSMTRTRAARFVAKRELPLAVIGASVTVNLPTGGEREVVTVHKDSVLVRQGGRMVFKISKENKATPTPVELGAAVGSRFEVLSGLEAGDQVVVRGNERLRPGQEVTFNQGPESEKAGKDGVPAAKGDGSAAGRS